MRVRKYTIGPYGIITHHGARAEAQRVFAASLDGRDPATEKREGRRRLTLNKVEDVIGGYDKQHLSSIRSGKEIWNLLDRVVPAAWRGRSVHEISKRNVIELIASVEQRGTPSAANKLTKVLRAFFHWCIGRGVLERSPADAIPLPAKEVSRDRILSDAELAAVVSAARAMGGPFGGFVQLLAITGQRREKIARLAWDELDLDAAVWALPKHRTKNGKAHTVHLSEPARDVLTNLPRLGAFVFTSK